MENNEKFIEVFCNTENRRVGKIVLTHVTGKLTLSLPVISSLFVPDSDKYKLTEIVPQRALTCPKCYGRLVLRGDVRTDESDEVVNTDSIMILVDRTKLEVSK